MLECSCGSNVINDYECEITSAERLTEKLFWLTVKCSELAERAKPGHCVMVFASDADDPLLGRPFAVADADPIGGCISVCVSIVGRGTKLLLQKLVGETVRVRGLFGVPHPTGERVRLLCGGVGAAVFLLYYKLYSSDVEGFYLGIPGGGYEGFAAKIMELVPEAKIFTDDGSFGEGTSMFKFLPGKIDGSKAVWACGPVGFFKAVKRHYEASPQRLWFSLENRMACGYGGCMGCVVRTKDGLRRVCVDQALFRADEVDLDEH